MELVSILGLIGGVLTTISFLPPVIRVWKTRSTKDLSLSMFLLFVLGVFFWLLYGIFKHEWPLIIANLTTLSLACVILFFKIKYK